jgi:hypothetical protein
MNMMRLPRALPGPEDYYSLATGALRRDANTAEYMYSVSTICEDDVDRDHSTIKYVARLSSASVAAEDLGGRAAEALLSLHLEPRERAGLVRAMWDEVRHSALFGRLSTELNGTVPASTPDGHPLLELLIGEAHPLTFLVLHVELEAIALDVFRVIAAHVQSERCAQLYRLVAQDEASHVRLGRRLIATQSALRGISGGFVHDASIHDLREAHYGARVMTQLGSATAAEFFVDSFELNESVIPRLRAAADERWTRIAAEMQQQGRR